MTISAISLALAFVLQAPTKGGAKDWDTFTSAQGGFSVQLPGKPDSQVTTQQTPAGPIQVPMLVYKDGTVGYVALSVKNPSPVPLAQQKDFFDGVRGSFAQGGGKKLVSEDRHTFNGVPAADYVVEMPGPDGAVMIMRARFVLADENTSLNAQVIAPQGQSTEKEAARFFKSLKVAKVTKAAAEKPAAPVVVRWRNISAPAAGFSIRMPAKPELSETTQESPNGDTKIRTYQVDLKTRAFLATRYDFPDSVAKLDDAGRQKALDNLCNGTVTGMKGKMLALKADKLGSVPGRDFQFNFPGPGGDALGRARAFLDGGKGYLLMVVGVPGEVNQPDTDTFLKSFKLLDTDNPKGPATRPNARPKTARPKAKVN